MIRLIHEHLSSEVKKADATLFPIQFAILSILSHDIIPHAGFDGADDADDESILGMGRRCVFGYVFWDLEILFFFGFGNLEWNYTFLIICS